MSDTPTRGDEEQMSQTSDQTFSSLLAGLRQRAELLTGEHREIAFEHLEHLQAEAKAEKPRTVRMQVWLKGLEVFGPLAPLIERALEALSSVGL